MIVGWLGWLIIITIIIHSLLHLLQEKFMWHCFTVLMETAEIQQNPLLQVGVLGPGEPALVLYNLVQQPCLASFLCSSL